MKLIAPIHLIFAAFLAFSSVLASEVREQSPAVGVSLSQEDIVKQTTSAEGHRLAMVDDSVRIWCQMQDLIGELGPEGLRITSIDDGEPGTFSVHTIGLGRGDHSGIQTLGSSRLVVDGSTARRIYDQGLVEEITTSSNGIRQDWVLPERTDGSGPLILSMYLHGATVTHREDDHLDLALAGGRELVWHSLLVTDALGTTLPARFRVADQSLARIEVDDSHAVYPVRIDPTFSDADWVSMGGLRGVNGYVYAAVPYGNGIVIAGQFSIAGTVRAANIAQWNGSSWSVLGSGVDGDVFALAASNEKLYAGGAFSSAGGNPARSIAQWNGSTWQPLKAGVQGLVKSMVFSQGVLYVGGYFSVADSIPAENIAAWNGSAWSALGSGTNQSVAALVADGSTIYAGGEFTLAGGINASRIAKWNGSSWANLGVGLNGNVEALLVNGVDLYAGGSFGAHIAKWNGVEWTSIGQGLDGIAPVVRSLAFLGGDLYVGGQFIGASGVPAKNIVKWNGTTWSAIGSGTSGDVYALIVSGTDIYVGGDLVDQPTSFGGGLMPGQGIAKWNGSAWSSLGSGFSGGVNALALMGNDLYVAGNFNMIGNTLVRKIAKWNGASWSSLGSGLNGQAYALATMNGDLYVGGAFSQAGGLESLKIAKWSGSSWSPVGFRGIGDVNSIETVDSLAVSGGMLYAGGNFKSAGQVSNQASNIARWDGTSWSSMGSGVDGRVYALTASGSAVYAGGSFTSAGGNPADGIAKWNGTTWSPLGLGIGGIVWSIVTTGNDVYVGGEFYDAGYQEASRVAKWNGSAWSPVGSGMDGTVHSLALYGGKLYAGGQFEKADGKVAYNIAMWNGNTWSPLGSGLDGGVSNMVISPTGDLYACGNFVAARNSTVSPYLIRGLIRNDAPVISAPAKSEPPIMLLP